MNKYWAIALASVCFVLALGVRVVYSQGNQPSTVQVHMVITDQTFNDSNEVPVLRPDSVKVRVGKDDVKVQQLMPAQGESAALQLFLLIDDTSDSAALGTNLNDLKEFVTAQPGSTSVGVAYMSNATIQVVQNLTTDHALAVKALRLPLGRSSAMDSPYLSLVSLVRSWPQQKVRREVLMISDGIDRLRGDNTGTPGGGRPGARTTMPTISLDAVTASRNSQRYGVIVHSIYSPGIGRLSRNMWEAQLGQGGVAKIADETGGEYFALGPQNPVSFKPYLERLQKILDNQYFLVLQVPPRKKEGLQQVRITTTLANADIAAANNVWVSAAGA